LKLIKSAVLLDEWQGNRGTMWIRRIFKCAGKICRGEKNEAGRFKTRLSFF